MEDKKPSITVSYNKDTGVFSFAGRAINITKQKNAALAPYNKMVRNYGLVFELKPSKEDIVNLNTQIGNARFMRNQYLSTCKQYYEATHLHLSMDAFKKEYFSKLRKEYPFLNKSDKFSLESGVENVDKAFTRFFKKEGGYPHFAAKDTHRGSMYTTKSTNNNIKLLHEKDGFFLKLPKMDKIRFVMPNGLSLEAIFGRNVRVLKVTVRKVGKRYFASLGMEDVIDLVVPKATVRKDMIFASDMGLKVFAIYGNKDFTEKVENPRWIAYHAKRLRRKQQALSRKKKGSKNYAKARLEVAKVHRKCANQRKDFQHKLSRKIVNMADVFVCEDLNVSGMMKNRHLSKAIASVGWSQFLTFVKYKIEAKGGYFIKVDRFFPSSKLCHCCGYKNTDLELKDRAWTCPQCGTHHDRDSNAKENLLNEGIRLLQEQGVEVINTIAA